MHTYIIIITTFIFCVRMNGVIQIYFVLYQFCTIYSASTNLLWAEFNKVDINLYKGL